MELKAITDSKSTNKLVFNFPFLSNFYNLRKIITIFMNEKKHLLLIVFRNYS